MHLDEYLKENSISVADFALLIGAKSRATVYRYIGKEENKRIPTPEMLVRIIKTTGGQVTPNDFYEILLLTVQNGV